MRGERSNEKAGSDEYSGGREALKLLRQILEPRGELFGPNPMGIGATILVGMTRSL